MYHRPRALFAAFCVCVICVHNRKRESYSISSVFISSISCVTCVVLLGGGGVAMATVCRAVFWRRPSTAPPPDPTSARIAMNVRNNFETAIFTRWPVFNCDAEWE